MMKARGTRVVVAVILGLMVALAVGLPRLNYFEYERPEHQASSSTEVIAELPIVYFEHRFSNEPVSGVAVDSIVVDGDNILQSASLLVVDGVLDWGPLKIRKGDTVSVNVSSIGDLLVFVEEGNQIASTGPSRRLSMISTDYPPTISYQALDIASSDPDLNALVGTLQGLEAEAPLKEIDISLSKDQKSWRVDYHFQESGSGNGPQRKSVGNRPTNCGYGVDELGSLSYDPAAKCPPGKIGVIKRYPGGSISRFCVSADCFCYDSGVPTGTIRAPGYRCPDPYIPVTQPNGTARCVHKKIACMCMRRDGVNCEGDPKPSPSARPSQKPSASASSTPKPSPSASPRPSRKPPTSPSASSTPSASPSSSPRPSSSPKVSPSATSKPSPSATPELPCGKCRFGEVCLFDDQLGWRCDRIKSCNKNQYECDDYRNKKKCCPFDKVCFNWRCIDRNEVDKCDPPSSFCIEAGGKRTCCQAPFTCNPSPWGGPATCGCPGDANEVDTTTSGCTCIKGAQQDSAGVCRCPEGAERAGWRNPHFCSCKVPRGSVIDTSTNPGRCVCPGNTIEQGYGNSRRCTCKKGDKGVYDNKGSLIDCVNTPPS